MFGSKAKGKSPLTFGCIDFPPFCFMENGQAKGLEIEEAKKVFKVLGIPLKFTELPLKRLYNSVSEGEVDVMIGSPYTPALKGSILWTPKKSYTFSIVAIHLNSVKKIKKLEELKKHSIGWLKPYTFPFVGQYIKDNKIKYYKVGKLESGLKMLESRRLDYFIAYKEELDALGITRNSDLAVSTLHLIDLHFIISKKTPNAKKLLDKIIKLNSQ